MTTRPSLLDTAGVIFDVDGTLVDSVDLHAEAWQKAFAAFGYSFAFSNIRSQIGKGGDQLLPMFLTAAEVMRQGPAIEKYRGDLFKREYFAQVRAFPKVSELFLLLIEHGKKIALGSSCKSEDLASYKKIAGIETLSLVDVTSDDAKRSKPHPDIFNAALSRLGLHARQVMVVGDTPYDLTAAQKAGMGAVAVLCGGFSEVSLVEAGAVEIYRDPQHLLEALLIQYPGAVR